MQKTLLLNHLSAHPVCECPEKSRNVLLDFFQTIKVAIDKYGFENYIISDKEFWKIMPSSEYSLTDFINSLSKTNQRWIYELHRLACKSSTDFFSDELIERVMSFSPMIRGINKQSEHFGCAACVEDIVTISFSTYEFWHQTAISLDWYDGENKISAEDHNLGDIVYNVSTCSDIAVVLGFFPQKKITITQKHWESELSTTLPLDTFWGWFESLAESVQQSLFNVARTIQKKNWQARKGSSFQKLINNELCEIRCWPKGGSTIRVYVKVESPEVVVLLCGSEKKDQDDEIKRAIRIYSSYKEEAKANSSSP